jgi:hypothetical protein
VKWRQSRVGRSDREPQVPAQLWPQIENVIII